ncbi:hypothetical protein B0H34DRAFT_697262, partial [Crassisporium funariophilum]
PSISPSSRSPSPAKRASDGPRKKQRLVKKDEATTSEGSSNQTAALGIGRSTAHQKISLDDAIQEAKAFLAKHSSSLTSAAEIVPELDPKNPFFVDGLGTLYEDDPIVKERVDKLFERRITKVVFNTSGSGKTRLLVEGLCHNWGFYLTPDRVPRLGSTDFSLSLRNVEAYVEDGQFFSPTIPDSSTSREKALTANCTIARITFHHILLARLLVLEAFLSNSANVSGTQLRLRWTHLQLVPSALSAQFSSDEQDIFESVYGIIAKCQARADTEIPSVLTRIRQDYRVPSTSPLFIILDEAQICSHLYEGAFHSEKETGPEGIRSVLREISNAWEGFGQSNFVTFYSGTGFSLTKVSRSLSSSLGTVDNSVFNDLGAFVREEQQRAYIMHHVKLDEDTRDEVLGRAWRWLRGRHRFTAGFVYTLQCCGTENASALLTHYVQALTDYTPMDGSNSRVTEEQLVRFPGFTKISQQFKKLEADGLLRKRVAGAIHNFMLRHKPQSCEPKDVQTIELGVSRYKTSSETDYKAIIIDEPLIIASLLQHFEGSPDSMEETLRGRLAAIPTGSERGYLLEVMGMYVLAHQLDGTKSLSEIFHFRTTSSNIRNGKAQLIAINGINQNGSLRYSIVNRPWLFPLGMGFEASDPSEHKKWFEGGGIPFCFPDTRSGHDLGFFVLVDDHSIVFVTNQFKSYNKDLNATITKRALQSLAPDECYKDENGKIYTPGKSARQTIRKVLKLSNTPCLGIITSFPSNPHFQTIDQQPLEHMALFDSSRIKGELGRMLAQYKDDQFPGFGDIILPKWEVEEPDIDDII